MKTVLALLVAAAAAMASAQDRIRDQIYMKQGGAAFTLDVFKAPNPNGITVVHLVSGGWVSDHAQVNEGLAALVNSRGFNLVQVVHGAQPRYKVTEIVGQVKRAIRFLRQNAFAYGIDVDRMGITGGSAGGHLSLMIASTADEGNPNATDPVEKQPAKVGSVGIFFPPTDFSNWGGDGVKAFDLPLLKGAFGNAFVPNVATASPDTFTQLANQLSPVQFFSTKMPPTLFVHGDQDKLVPIQQSQLAVKKLESLGVKTKLITVEGKDHGWPEMAVQYGQILDWFEETLKKK